MQNPSPKQVSQSQKFSEENVKWFVNDANFVNEVNFMKQDLSASINIKIT